MLHWQLLSGENEIYVEAERLQTDACVDASPFLPPSDFIMCPGKNRVIENRLQTTKMHFITILDALLN